VYRRHDSYPGFRTELENRVGDAKGKGASGEPTRPKVPMHRSGAHCFVRAMKWGNAHGAKGAGHPRQVESTGNRRLCQEDARASCCTKDEGRSFEAALQREASNSHKPLQSKAAVVNVMVKRRG
jgi:hypothetical protein